jgi:hypothetical protein
MLRESGRRAPRSEAICVPPGARLVLKSIPMDLRCKWSVGADESVFFMQTSAEVNTYRDALHFRTIRSAVSPGAQRSCRKSCFGLHRTVNRKAARTPQGQTLAPYAKHWRSRTKVKQSGTQSSAGMSFLSLPSIFPANLVVTSSSTTMCRQGSGMISRAPLLPRPAHQLCGSDPGIIGGRSNATLRPPAR